MEQQRGVGGGMEEMKGLTQQDRRGGGGGGVQVIKPNQENPQSAAQPQKCPRCESLNTKFCYYNNYSLSQPRYFCKTCRRYWTQGGTLRNVPVGGGCRKGKRSKKPSSSSSSSSSAVVPLPPPPSDHQNLMMNNLLLLQDQNQNQEIPNLTTTTTTITITEAPPINTSSMAVGSSNPPPLYYPSGGFLSSLAAFQSFNQPPSITVNPGGDFGVSNLALLQGFSLPSFIPPPSQQQYHHHQIHQQSQIPNMGIREKAFINQVLPLDENMNQLNRPSISQQQAEWPAKSFTNNSTSEAAGFWSSSSSSSTTGSISALNPTDHHHWSDHHVSGFGGPPTTSSSSPPPPPPPSLL